MAISEIIDSAASSVSMDIPKETLEFFNETEDNCLRSRVFYEKYSLRDEQGNPTEKTPQEMWRRVAREIASVEGTKELREQWESKFYWLLSDWKFIPGGRILFGAGQMRKSTLLNCYYFSPRDDSIEGIFDWCKEAARTYSFGGGCGVDISRLRPKGSPVNNSALRSTGSVSFMELMSTTTGTIGQCLAKGTSVQTQSRGLQPIERININDKVWSDIGWQKVSYVFPSRIKHLFQITTEYGCKIVASNEHKFMDAKMGMKPLQDFAIGDSIVMIRGRYEEQGECVPLQYVRYERDEYNNSNRLTEIKQPSILEENLAYWLGYVTGNGSVSISKKGNMTLGFAIPLHLPEILDRIILLTKTLFGLEIKNSCYTENEGCWKPKIGSNYLYQFLQANGICKDKSTNAIVFEKIMVSPKRVMAAFLAGLFDADGRLSSKKKIYTFATTSPELARQVRLILLSLGVVPKLYIDTERTQRTAGRWKPLYELPITGTSSITAFNQSIGRFSIKIMKNGVNDTRRDNVKSPYTPRMLGVIAANQKNHYVMSSDTCFSGRGLQLLVNGGYAPVAISNDLFVDKIIDIKSVGEMDAYDIEVENAHKFSANGFYVSNSGRRGALMITIDIDHPDVEDFITIKKNLTKVNFANISIKITDKFMKAVENDEDFELHFSSTKAKVNKKVKAKVLWNKLIDAARDSAEPGLIFWDTVKRGSTTEYNGMEVVGTNPCLSKGTFMLTDKGLVRIGTTSSFVNLWDGSEFVEAKIWKTGFKDTITLVTQSGYEIKCTPDHSIYTNEGWLNAKDALGHSLPFEISEQNYNGVIPEEFKTINYELLGFIMGNGGWHESSNRMRYMYFTPEDDDRVAKLSESYFGVETYEDGGEEILNIPYEAKEAYIFKGAIGERKIPDWMMQLPKQELGSFLRGLFSANGSVIREHRIQLVSKDKELLKHVQVMLTLLGIKAKLWYHSKEPAIKRKNGTYVSKKSWHLVISRDSLVRFHKYIGFIQTHKQIKLEKALTKNFKPEMRYERVVEVMPSGYDEVYDFGMAMTHHSIVNGIKVHNCSEIPLDEYGCCCLGSINLSAFVHDMFTEKACIGTEELSMACQYATRFLDDVLEYNKDKHPLPQQREASLRSRRIGVGLTGLGDMLIKLGIKYDSDTAIDFVDKMLDTMKNEVYSTSALIANEKGKFPVYDEHKHMEQLFIKGLDTRTNELVKKYGLRNAALLTVPPVGSGSILTGSSSGVEPVFALSYKRRSKSLSKAEYDVQHPLINEFAKYAGDGFEAKGFVLPDYFVTAHQIDPMFRVKMQATIQKHTDHAISSTVNVSRDTTSKTVGDIYFLAWKLGCKGITVYREGSREGILETNDKKNESVVEKDLKKVAQKSTPSMDKDGKVTSSGQEEYVRPKIMEGKTIKFSLPQGSLYVTANNGTGEYKEIFVTLGKLGGDEKADAEAIGRLASLYLQEGGKMEKVVSAMKGIRGRFVVWEEGVQLLSLPDAVAKALEVISTGKVDRKNNEAHGDVCPSCSDNALISENGCEKCLGCGFSRCG